jgi:hypothetical protein
MYIQKYNYLNVVWTYIMPENAKKMVLTFMEEYYKKTDMNVTSDFTVTLLHEEYDIYKMLLDKGQRLLIHNSDKVQFHEYGVFIDKGFVRYVYNLVTKSVCIVNLITNEVKIYNSDILMLARDGIRITRDILKVIVENKSNATMLHASGVFSDEYGSFIFIGEKGKGKTTISLKLMYDYGFFEMSRDRLYLVEEENHSITVHGWPTYYNLNYDTIKTFTHLNYLLNEDLSNMEIEDLKGIKEKIKLTTSSQMKIRGIKSKNPLDYVVFLCREKEPFDPYFTLAKNCLSPNDSYTAEWHGIHINKERIYNNARYLLSKMINSKNIIYLFVENEVDKTVKKLLNEVENLKKIKSMQIYI